MRSLFRAALERLKALVVTSIALELESEFLARDAERRAELLRQAGRYEAEGLPGVAGPLRKQAEALSPDRPLASVLPAAAHLLAELPAPGDLPALPAHEPNAWAGSPAPALTLYRPPRRGGK